MPNTSTNSDAYAWRIATALSDHADELGIMNVTVEPCPLANHSHTVTAWHITDQVVAFTIHVPSHEQPARVNDGSDA